MLESYLQNGWYKIITQESVAKPKRWLRMIIYLEAQLSIIQTRAFEAESADLQLAQQLQKKDSDKDGKHDRDKKSGMSMIVEKEVCNLCDEQHVNSNKGFSSCKKFLLMTHKRRAIQIKKKKYCLQCLDVSTRWNDPEHCCSDRWICRNESHEKYAKKLHFLVCEFHTCDEKNVELLEEFKKEILKAEWQQKLLKNLSTCNLNISGNDSVLLKTKTSNVEALVDENDFPDATVMGSPVFLLQPVPFNGHVFNFMFDSGCENFVCRKAALDFLPEENKENVIKGPIVINGVGCNKVISQHGHFSVKLPIHDGRLARFSGICLDVITGPMPPYPVREASKPLIKDYESKRKSREEDLPKVPVLVGGETDFLFGIRYNFFQPRLKHILNSGLAIYKSIFKGVDGTRGCIGGPSEVFEMCEKQFLETNTVAEWKIYLQQQLKLYSSGIKVCLDCDSITAENSLASQQIAIVDDDGVDDDQHVSPVVLMSAKKKFLTEADEAGSVIEYRCLRCRGCKDCKNSEHVQKISLREEFEQHLIDASVSVDFDRNQTNALLPFVADPIKKLESNEENADKVYFQQVKKLSKIPDVKAAVLESELKLQDNGHVEWKKKLSSEELTVLNNQSAKYYMPWRFIHNENSVTTPVRIVFDASSVTRTGHSLNDLLAKGINSLNSMLEIFTRFCCNIIAVHTDIKKMYNVVKLKSDHWTYQRYKWHESLDPTAAPEEKIIKTIIYGVKSSGNQAQVGLRETARRQQEEYPEAANAIVRDTYVDDCATGVNVTPAGPLAEKLVKDIDKVLAKGGFITKGYTLSGSPPPPGLSRDGESINVLGIKWIPEQDKLQLAGGLLNFSKKHRGKRAKKEEYWKVPNKLSKRIIAGKVGEVFDIAGFVAPIIAGFKLDIRKLIELCCGWDDRIPDKYRDVWLSNFQLMEQIGDLIYNRAVVPSNAVDMNVEIIGAGDASEKMACSGSYIRFKLRDNGYSCQLILAKTKIVPGDTTLPRAELFAATLCVHVFEIARRSLKNNIVDYLMVLDSEIALYWLSSQSK